ncbi:hypothetical protein M7I_2037 [Glarea lozoyensis 74030]|uniref:Uncharacterized protein n=1 Tax=Glarea lozoyensis (strain ATCC 74030 / MF5533) TaxID=1104152 RepID=H0EHQ3_GLAL7|nr:hypothetical protein M7I_2037 [Glarea lozoyensis 74030]
MTASKPETVVHGPRIEVRAEEIFEFEGEVDGTACVPAVDDVAVAGLGSVHPRSAVKCSARQQLLK